MSQVPPATSTMAAVPPAAASRIPPAGAGTKMESIDSASNEVKQLVRQLNRCGFPSFRIWSFFLTTSFCDVFRANCHTWFHSERNGFYFFVPSKVAEAATVHIFVDRQALKSHCSEEEALIVKRERESFFFLLLFLFEPPSFPLLRSLSRRFATASTLSEHAGAMQGFDEDMTLDTPFIQVQVWQTEGGNWAAQVGLILFFKPHGA
eukprot:1141950-Pelagomonas_calceolata.AAC.9